MFKKLILCSVWAVLYSLPIFSQTKIISGKVTDIETQLETAKVRILTSEKKLLATTNNNGEFSINTIKFPIQLIFSLEGYTDKTINITKSSNNLRVQLEKEATLLSEIVISAKNEKKLGIQKVSKISLQLRPISSAQDYLKAVPGLFIAQHAGGGKAEQIFLRGFDNDHGTDFAVLVDDIGINLSSHAHGQGYADLHFIIPETVNNADYYKGPHETSLGNFAVSGAAKFTSKEL